MNVKIEGEVEVVLRGDEAKAYLRRVLENKPAPVAAPVEKPAEVKYSAMSERGKQYHEAKPTDNSRYYFGLHKHSRPRRVIKHISRRGVITRGVMRNWGWDAGAIFNTLKGLLSQGRILEANGKGCIRYVLNPRYEENRNSNLARWGKLPKKEVPVVEVKPEDKDEIEFEDHL